MLGYRIIKRFWDVVLSALLLTLLSPLLLPLVVALRVTGEGEIFYRQRRIGKGWRPFGIYKFATMLKDSPRLGTGMITLRNDPRVTPVGRYLRRSKINELPQILNVLLGDMSWVGPRPLVEKNYENYTPDMRAAVAAVPPGITGVGSIIFRDEELLLSRWPGDPKLFYRDYIAPYKGALEVWYFHNRGFWTDTKILLLTGWAIFQPETALIYRWLPNLPSPPREVRLETVAA